MNTRGECRDLSGVQRVKRSSSSLEIAKAADAAALSATAEISQRVFEETGDLQPSSKTWANAQELASINNGYLSWYGVNVVVTGISVDAGDDIVLVQVSVNLDRLFPSVVPDVMVTENGYSRSGHLPIEAQVLQGLTQQHRCDADYGR